MQMQDFAEPIKEISTAAAAELNIENVSTSSLYNIENVSTSSLYNIIDLTTFILNT